MDETVSRPRGPCQSQEPGAGSREQERGERAFAMRFKALPALLALGALGACDQAPTSQRTYLHPNGTEWLFRATVERPIPVERHGSPFPGADAALDAYLADAFAAARPALRFRYGVARPTDEADPADPRVVLAFQSAEDGRSGIALCRGERRGREAAGPIHVLGVVCRDGRRFAEVRAFIDKEVSMDSEAFRRLIGQTARALIDGPPRE